MDLKKYFNWQIILFTIFIVMIFFIGYANFTADKQIASEINNIAQTVQSQQKSISTLDNLPGNKNSLASSAPGEVVVDVKTDISSPSLGNANAPVTIIEFADFQCPFCQKFFANSESDLISKYVDTGKARLVFEDFPFLGQESEDAAEAAKCAQAQGQFWPYHNYLYSHQDPSGENKGGFSISHLEAFAKIIPGIDSEKFNSCLDEHQELNAVQTVMASGYNYGVTSTPTIFIDGKEIVGLYETSVYESMIDAELKK
jgi:protein-disulfide isomerase